ncbi:MAG: hypothetical protein E7643_08845 [Ruminococcaceae bacterium]|nr:hypothetical protein [Oscillospiraceae bacterium]
MNAKAFFLRFDVIRKVCRSLLVLLMIVLFFARSWSLGVVGIVFFSVALVASTIGSVLHTVKDYKLSEFISEARHVFETEVKKENKSFRHGEPALFYAYSREKENFARALGRRLIYPVCLNMMFLRHGNGGTLIVGRLSLWNKERPTKEKFKFKELTVSFLRLEGDAEILSVAFLEGDEEKLRFYVRDDHFWRAFVDYAKENCRVLEEVA